MPSPAQITSDLRPVQGKSRTITVADVRSLRAKGDSACPAGAYLHIPFCFHKCHYCDFYSLVDTRDRQAAFVDRLIAELGASQPWLTAPLQTIFVGGGTPTLLSPDLWLRLMPAIGEYLPLNDGGEFTIEANPETVTRELIDILAAGGVNRISIGAQSFHHRHLKTLERWHDPVNVARAVQIVRDAGIDNINLDLIFAIPGQTLDDWMNDLDAALTLAPSHLSCYGLMYEPNTPLTARMKSGEIERADEDLEAAMYEATIDRLAAAGFEQYEISNWSLQGRICRHNMLYWTDENWWPLGPSAAGHLGGVRWKNVRRLDEYLNVSPLPPISDIEQLDHDRHVGETLMLRLRLREGIALALLDHLLNDSQSSIDRRATIAHHENAGLLERTPTHLRFTRRGLLLADTVLSDLV